MESTVSRERPILFKDWEVRAILDGRKTQTRRPVVPGPSQRWLTQSYIQSVPHGEMYEDKGLWQMHHPKAGTRHMGVDVEYDSPGGCVRSPFGVPGDRLWVREAWELEFSGGFDAPVDGVYTADRGYVLLYRADGREIRFRYEGPVSEDPYCALSDKGPLNGGWRPSIHMPRWASRLTLEVKRVWVERVQEISGFAACAEGYPGSNAYHSIAHDGGGRRARAWFHDTWDAIYAKRGLGWDANPWVWCCEFEVAK